MRRAGLRAKLAKLQAKRGVRRKLPNIYYRIYGSLDSDVIGIDNLSRRAGESLSALRARAEGQLAPSPLPHIGRLLYSDAARDRLQRDMEREGADERARRLPTPQTPFLPEPEPVRDMWAEAVAASAIPRNEAGEAWG